MTAANKKGYWLCHSRAHDKVFAVLLPLSGLPHPSPSICLHVCTASLQVVPAPADKVHKITGYPEGRWVEGAGCTGAPREKMCECCSCTHEGTQSVLLLPCYALLSPACCSVLPRGSDAATACATRARHCSPAPNTFPYAAQPCCSQCPFCSCGNALDWSIGLVSRSLIGLEHAPISLNAASCPDALLRICHLPTLCAPSWINYVSWSPDSKHIAFTTRSPGGPNDPPRQPLELWLACPTSGQVRGVNGVGCA